MNHVLLYGPPAAGKLTVAQALAESTGYRLLHNHLTVDLALALFPFGTPEFGRYVCELRLQGLEVAARGGVEGVITTLVYALGEDDAFVRDEQEVVARHGGLTFPVHLSCDREELVRRVSSPSRSRFRKITEPDKLARVMATHELCAPIPFAPGLAIDTTNLPPTAAASRIATHYGLPAPEVIG